MEIMILKQWKSTLTVFLILHGKEGSVILMQHDHTGKAERFLRRMADNKKMNQMMLP